MSLSLVPLPCSYIGSYLFVSGIPVFVAGATGALLAMLALVAMVSHVVLGGSRSTNERRVGACCPCEARVGSP